MTPSPKLYDVWICRFRFFDIEDVTKVRPCIVISIDSKTTSVLVAKVTSHNPRETLGEYVIRDLQTAGLLKPSTVRCSQVIEIEESKLLRKIGILTKSDIAGLKQALKDAKMVKTSCSEGQ